ncbi:hypothetical protein K4039_27960 [Lyngbya sp. CCAP 1446/10]|uniref:hypothetical protein n=1 Tax=Microcoleaceae TaxID=1892252 RepID=UPI002237B507|nr:hypothetical protein [Lyngbya sp. CCAP 1446/10]MCW6053782.1 hypothetical protein [Lyngbya sp. CCAP 1446/10]
MLISVFVNFRLSFQPSDNLYTMLARVCLLQIITGAYLSEKVNGGQAIAGQSTPYDRCGVVARNPEFGLIPLVFTVEQHKIVPHPDRHCALCPKKAYY